MCVCIGLRKATRGYIGLYELQPILATQCSGRGFLTKNYIRESTTLHEGPLLSTVKGPLMGPLLTVAP